MFGHVVLRKQVSEWNGDSVSRSNFDNLSKNIKTILKKGRPSLLESKPKNCLGVMWTIEK